MTAKKKLEPRKLMEMAIDVMKKSVAEPRGDGKASPLVGAVLWKPDGTVETASRGELRDGDHAEFTLLERKNRDCNRTAKNHLKKLTELGLLRMVGAGRATHYEVVRS